MPDIALTVDLGLARRALPDVPVDGIPVPGSSRKSGKTGGGAVRGAGRQPGGRGGAARARVPGRWDGAGARAGTRLCAAAPAYTAVRGEPGALRDVGKPCNETIIVRSFE